MKNYLKVFCLLAVQVAIVIPVSSQFKEEGTIFQFKIAKKGIMLDDATCNAWIPDGIGTIRSVIVHLHGCTREGDSRQMMYDIQWRELAKKWHSVLLAPAFVTGGDSKTCTNWYIPSNGSDEVYLEMLDSLAIRSNHEEIRTVPWALWGHSGGSYWITAMTGKYPQRVAVAVAQSCGVDISDSVAALKVPVLHHNGVQDICNMNNKLFANGRNKGALWAHAVNPVVQSPMDGHQVHDLRFLAIPWIDAFLKMRLPDQYGSSTLKDIDVSHAWLGDTASKSIAPARSFTGDKNIACWFPNKELASKWVEYTTKGTITDASPPSTPYGLSAVYRNKQVALRWSADADLESGIKTFIVYRDGKEFQTLQYQTKTKYSKEKGYQRWNDGDQPAPIPAPEMIFVDQDINNDETHTYQVSSINWSGTISKKSKKISLKKGKIK